MLDFLLENIFLLLIIALSGFFLLFPRIFSAGAQALSVKDAILMMNRNPCALIDLRSKDDFTSGHIANAQNIPYESIEKSVETLKKYSNKHLILYCQKGIRSEKALSLFQKIGMEKVYSIEGGLDQWIKGQLPLASEKKI
jgi:rhodanese-related sulfurtransferase